jgi:hypothetical protein
MNQKVKLLLCLLGASALLASVAVAASSPSVSTGRATAVKSFSAVLNGTINPNGSSTHYRFELGLNKSYGITVASNHAVYGTRSVSVKLTARHLLPGTTYHYRLVATNGVGSSFGADRKFKTAGNPPPGAATGPATDIGKHSAFVTGVINPHHEQTQYVFQYGVSKAYNVETFQKTVAASSKPVTVAELLTGLAAGTTYHYRLVAMHGSAVVQAGRDSIFFTQPARRPRPRVRARVKPHHARRAPFVFTISGRVKGPRWIPRYASCFSNLLVKFFRGRRRVAVIVIPVLPDCRFSGQAVFRHLPGRRGRHRHVRLRVVIHFRGNGYLAPANAPRKRVLLG